MSGQHSRFQVFFSTHQNRVPFPAEKGPDAQTNSLIPLEEWPCVLLAKIKGFYCKGCAPAVTESQPLTLKGPTLLVSL